MNKTEPDYEAIVSLLGVHKDGVNAAKIWLQRVYEMGVASGKEEAWQAALKVSKEWKVM